MTPMTPDALSAVDVELLALLDSPSRRPATLGKQTVVPHNSPVGRTPPEFPATQQSRRPRRTATSIRQPTPNHATSSSGTEDYTELHSNKIETKDAADESSLRSERVCKPGLDLARRDGDVTWLVRDEERRSGGKSASWSDTSQPLAYSTLAREYRA